LKEKKMATKTSNGNAQASCSGEINQDNSKYVNMLCPAQMKRVAELVGVPVSEVKIAHCVWIAIFNNIPFVQLPNKSTITASRTAGGLRQFRWGRWLFIEQNPNSGSEWASRANGGSHIMWVINVEATVAKYAARVVDGRLKVIV